MDTRDLDAFEKLVYLALKGVGNTRKIMRERERERERDWIITEIDRKNMFYACEFVRLHD